jgi:hypothetical protein
MNKRLRTASALSAACMLAACAGPAATPQEPAPASTTANDPVLSAAADDLEPYLRASFADSFAGVILDHTDRKLIVYRRPDPGFDAAARRQAGSARMEIRDANYSLRQMQDLATKVTDDTAYWQSQGIAVNGAGPLPDGSGVQVMTDTGSTADQEAMDDRYGTGAIQVIRGSAQAPVGRTPWRPSQAATPPTQ